MTTMYFAVFATRRSDLGEWIVSLVSTEALARVVGWWTLDDMPGLLRCRVKRVWLTRPEVFEVVKVWGRLRRRRLGASLYVRIKSAPRSLPELG